MTTGRPRDAGIGTISAMVAALAIALVTAPQPASAQGPLTLVADNPITDIGGCDVRAHAVWSRDAQGNNNVTVDSSVHDPFLFVGCRGSMDADAASTEVEAAIIRIQAAIAADKTGDTVAALAHDEAALEHDQAALKLLLMDADRGSMEVGEAITHIQAAIEHNEEGNRASGLEHNEAALKHDEAALKLLGGHER